jgi:replicative DNA helicase
MKTLEHHERTKLETEILWAICARPEFLHEFELTDSHFAHPLNKKVFHAIKELHNLNQPISLLTLSDVAPLSELKTYFEENVFNIYTSRDFLIAAERLHEDVVRYQLINKIDMCGDSLEYMRFVDSLRQLSHGYNLQSFSEYFETYANEYQERQTRLESGGSIGLILDWKYFNEKIALTPADYVVLGARTSVGKTTFALNVAIQAAAFGHKVLFITTEMVESNITDKILAYLTKTNSWQYKYGHADLSSARTEINAIKDNFFMVYAPSATTDTVVKLASKAKFDLIVVDYLQQLKDTGGQTENHRLGGISSRLKQIAGQNKCVVLAPCQLNRDSEKNNREPNLADLRDSGSIEQDADMVLLLHREKRDLPEVELIIAKNRNGALGRVSMAFNGPYCMFVESKIQNN